MVKVQAIEGMISGKFHFRYDIAADRLQINLPSMDGMATSGEHTPAGDTLVRNLKTGTPVALTANNWWKRNGQGSLPDSISELEKHIEPLANSLSA
jgi:hypothetical protein